MKQTSCQDQTDGSDPELEDQNAEYDRMLTETAGEVIPSLAKVVGGERFAPYFAGLLPEFMKRLVRLLLPIKNIISRDW